MKATLEYILPEDQDDLNMAISAPRMHAAISSFLEYLRQKIKYEDLSEEKEEIYEEVRTKLYEYLENYEVTVD